MFKLGTGKLPFNNPFDETKNEIFERIKIGKINKFPSEFDNILKDLILKLLNPDPWKRLGYKELKDLILHPYFDGCFSENGKLIKKKLVKATFKVEKIEDEKQLKPIPHEIFYRFGLTNEDLSLIHI